jgi:hypothetical protein
MTEEPNTLGGVLDRLTSMTDRDEISLGEIVERLGHHSFAAVMLGFALVSTSPASAIPGVTTAVALIVFLLIAQMLAGRDSMWLPGFIVDWRIRADKLVGATKWLRGPVTYVERLLRPRIALVFSPPWIWLGMLAIVALTVAMPFLEILPLTGSLASAVIALFAASLLTRDGLVFVLSFAILAVAPLVGILAFR